jgi:hypothetical protein
MVYKLNLIKADSSVLPANDSYDDILRKYTVIYKDDAKNKLAREIRAEFKMLGEKAKHIVASMDMFSVDSYEYAIKTIIAIDKEMSRKIAGLEKIAISIS